MNPLYNISIRDPALIKHLENRACCVSVITHQSGGFAIRLTRVLFEYLIHFL